MTNLAAALETLGDALAAVVDAAFAADGLRAAGDDELLAVLGLSGRLLRGAEAVMSESVGQLLEREDLRAHPDRLTTRHGCRSVGELVQRVTRVSGRTAAGAIAVAKATRCRASLSTGELLPAELPRMREALGAGTVGADGMLAVIGAFRTCGAGRAEMLAADEELAAAAGGEGTDAAPPTTADELRALALVWAAYLDQDGAEPAEERAIRKRGFTVGRRGDDGLVPVRGNLLPEVAAQLELGFDSILNPKSDGAPAAGPSFAEQEERDPDAPIEALADHRTRTQKQHDALAILLTAAAASGELPMLGGAAPTLVVSVREQDLASSRGYAYLPDGEPVSIAAARRVACGGAVERVVLGENGRIVSIATLDRIFNHHQRRAIGLRDGTCVIPGCHVRAQWCEIHHVEEHSRGGPTHTDNGVLLCWSHHRTIDNGTWQIRMVDGVPYVKGPYWWDAQVKWRPVTTSPTRRRDQLARRL